MSKYGGVDYRDIRTRSSPSDYSAEATIAMVIIVMMIDVAIQRPTIVSEALRYFGPQRREMRH